MFRPVVVSVHLLTKFHSTSRCCCDPRRLPSHVPRIPLPLQFANMSASPNKATVLGVLRDAEPNGDVSGLTPNDAVVPAPFMPTKGGGLVHGGMMHMGQQVTASSALDAVTHVSCVQCRAECLKRIRASGAQCCAPCLVSAMRRSMLEKEFNET